MENSAIPTTLATSTTPGTPGSDSVASSAIPMVTSIDVEKVTAALAAFTTLGSDRVASSAIPTVTSIDVEKVTAALAAFTTLGSDRVASSAIPTVTSIDAEKVTAALAAFTTPGSDSVASPASVSSDGAKSSEDDDYQDDADDAGEEDDDYEDAEEDDEDENQDLSMYSPRLIRQTSDLVRVQPPERIHKDWSSWEAYLAAYSVETMQIIPIKEKMSTAERNKRLGTTKAEKRGESVPLEWEAYQRTYICTHGWSKEPRGTGKRPRQHVRSTGSFSLHCADVQ